MATLTKVVSPTNSGSIEELYDTLDYIESSGTQVINTGVKVNELYGFESSILPVSLAYPYQRFFYGKNSNSQLVSYGSIDRAYLGITGVEKFRDGVVSTTDFNDIVIKNGNYNLFNKTGTYSGAFGSSSTLFSLFAEVDGTKGSATKLKRTKLYGSDNALIRDFLPAKRKSDDVVGLLDLVEKKFYTNSGTGTFSYGSIIGEGDIHVLKATPVCELVKFKNWELSYYKKLDYIESSMAQYIDTGFKVNNNTRIVCDFNTLTRINWRGFGSYQRTGSAPTNAMSINTTNAENTYQAYYGSGSATRAFTVDSTVGRYTFDYDKNVVKVNNETKATFTAQTFQSTINTYVFALNDNGTPNNLMQVQLYSYKIYDNGTLARDMVPCELRVNIPSSKSADGNAHNAGEIGLWDIVNDKFYANAGTGTFIKGNVIDEGESKDNPLLLTITQDTTITANFKSKGGTGQTHFIGV